MLDTLGNRLSGAIVPLLSISFQIYQVNILPPLFILYESQKLHKIYEYNPQITIFSF